MLRTIGLNSLFPALFHRIKLVLKIIRPTEVQRFGLRNLEELMRDSRDSRRKMKD
jgi:hypothetical protein